MLERPESVAKPKRAAAELRPDLDDDVGSRCPQQVLVRAKVLRELAQRHSGVPVGGVLCGALKPVAPEVLREIDRDRGRERFARVIAVGHRRGLHRDRLARRPPCEEHRPVPGNVLWVVPRISLSELHIVKAGQPCHLLERDPIRDQAEDTGGRGERVALAI